MSHDYRSAAGVGIDTPNGTFEIAFDYQVLDAGCALEVSLDGQALETFGSLEGTDD